MPPATQAELRRVQALVRQAQAAPDKKRGGSLGVGVGDVLTFPQGGRIRLVRVLSLGERRGPATEAAELYLDLDAPAAAVSPLE